VENKSGVSVSLLIDPVGTTAKLKYTIPNGQTISSDPNDNFSFYSIGLVNEGLVDVAISDITINVRNY
jgi:hypothetical protein